MDMITSMEMEDGIKAWKRLESRILDVATTIATLENDILKEDVTSWRLQRFHISTTARSDLEPQTSVRLVADWEERPWTMRYGYPGDDDEDFYERGEKYDLIRSFSFPTRYLTSDDWEDEVRETSLRIARMRLDRRIEDLTQAIKSSSEDQVRFQEKLEDLKRERQSLS